MKKLLLFFFILLLLEQNTGLAQCNPDVTPPVAVCVSDIYHDLPPTGTIILPATEFNAGSYDACSPSNTLDYLIERAPQSASVSGSIAIDFLPGEAGVQQIVLWVVDSAGNASTCITNLHLNICPTLQSLACNDQITVQLDVNLTADLDAFDMLEGGPYCDYNTYKIRLDQAGGFQEHLTLTPDDIGVHLMEVSGIGAVCWGTVIVEPGVLNADCPQLYVDMANFGIRPCFTSSYKIYYANASTLPVTGTHVDVTLDDQLDFQGSSIPATDLGNNVYRFETGDLDPGESGIFDVQFFTDCDAPVGTTHCSEAHIFPDTICPAGLTWSGAEVSVEGHCVNDTIHLTIKNTGHAPMAQTLDYIVVEDVLMLQEQSFQLGQGQSLNLPPIPANGSTYRLEAEQEPGYPYGGMPSVTIEGCGGLNPGLVTMFPTENANPAISVFCRESTGPFDPNDKQALPKGFDADHLIAKNTTLDYMIRFQNVGNDIAFKVVLLDTLSGFLDATSIRPGAASHPYKFELLQGNILRVTFDNINLPHKTLDEAGSQGFVQFAIHQKPDNPDGTRIENTAAIYFDFNAPVITNRTFHTVGTHYIPVVSTNEARPGLPQIQVFPNPSTDLVMFSTEMPAGETVTFSLTDALGRVVRQRNNIVFPMAFQRGTLENGAYFFQFTGRDGRIMWSGKVLIR